MKNIKTVQDLIDRLESIIDKDAPIEISSYDHTTEQFEPMYSTNLYDLQVVETDKTVILTLFR